MSKDLTKPDQSKGIAKDEALWLLNLANGRVFPWTALLAVRKGFIDCTADGRPINPKDVPGDHPWIRKQTQGLADRMRKAGANADTLYDFGRQLTDDAAAKFKQLEYEKASTRMLPGKADNLVDVKEAGWVGMEIRVMNKIDAAAQRAKEEINAMAIEALMSHGFKRWEASSRLGI